MGHIRWLKISEALAKLGHQVDIATNERTWSARLNSIEMGPRLRRVNIRNVRWSDYSVVKTLFHRGYQTLGLYGGGHHPFVISKLGSVVAGEDRPGIYFYGAARASLYETQVKIHRKARYVTVLSPAAADLWTEAHGRHAGLLLVPGGVDAEVPLRGERPWPVAGKVCLFSGNIYTKESQPEANRALVAKLNRLGARLKAAGITLVFQGPGDTDALQSKFVVNLRSCTYEESWNYMQHADVGIVLTPGVFLHNNESSKIYHYLRVGLPTVCEQGFPNQQLVLDAGLGFVSAAEDPEAMADAVIQAASAPWDRESAKRFILAAHTWDHRARVYQPHLEGVGEKAPLRYRLFGR